MIFPSKKDWWLTLILVVASIVQVVAGVAMLIEGSSRWVGVVLLLAAAFIWWLMLTTYYIVGDTELMIRSGPFRWTVPLNAIEEITPTRNPLSSPAMSLDRLWISYRHGGKQRAIMISPEDKAGFFRAVTAIVPGLEIVTSEGKPDALRVASSNMKGE